MLKNMKKITGNTVRNTMISASLITTALFGLSTMAFAAGGGVKKNENVSFEFNDTALKDIIQLIALSTKTQIVSYDLIPDVLISLKAEEVNGKRLQNYLLKCSGLKLSAQDKVFNIIRNGQSPEQTKIIECIEAFDA